MTSWAPTLTATWLLAEEALDDTGNELQQNTLAVLERLVYEYAPRLGWVAVFVFLGWLIGTGVRLGMRNLLIRRETPSFARVMSRVTGWIVVTVFVLIGVTVAFPSVKPVDVLAGLGFFSVAVGYAFRDILENTLAGVLLLFRQPFQTGDEINVGDVSGTVLGITIRETQIKTFDGVIVLVPNRDVYKGQLSVFTHFEVRRYSFMTGIAYENDAQEALDVARAALANIDGIHDDPAPVARIEQLGVSTVDIRVLFWADPHRSTGLRLTSEATIAVKQAFEARGIEMPADIIALQATPSFKAALQDDADVTPGGAIKAGDSA